MHPTASTPIMGFGRGLRNPQQANGYGSSGGSLNMQSSYYQRHRAVAKRRKYYLYFCSAVVVTAVYMCFNGARHTTEQAMRTTSRLKMSQPSTQLSQGQTIEQPELMKLVLLPADSVLPEGALPLDESALSSILSHSRPHRAPILEKKYIESWREGSFNAEEPNNFNEDPTMQQISREPSMGKTSIDESWNGGSLQAAEPTMGKKYIESWKGGSLQSAEPIMEKKYIESRKVGSMQAEEPVLEKTYIEWKGGSMQAVDPNDVHNAEPAENPSQPEDLSPGESRPSQDHPPHSARFHLHLPEHLVEELRSKIVDPAEAWQSSFNNSSEESYSSETQAKDQLIIIGTVASMALLVGAISARKMRRRAAARYGPNGYPDAASDWLSTCIENNAEDDMAYDAATTASGAYSVVMSNSGSNVYDTFSQVSNGWRNDLEKFDV